MDICAETSVPAAVASVATARAASSGTEAGAVFDNTDGSLEVNLNLLILLVIVWNLYKYQNLHLLHYQN